MKRFNLSLLCKNCFLFFLNFAYMYQVPTYFVCTNLERCNLRINIRHWRWIQVAQRLFESTDLKCARGTHNWDEILSKEVLRWSTCRLRFCCWLLDHVICLKLRKWKCCQQIQKIHSKWSWMKVFVMLWVAQNNNIFFSQKR